MLSSPPTLGAGECKTDPPCRNCLVSSFSTPRLFLYENIPQLRYHNPAVKFSFEAHEEAESKLHFLLGEFQVDRCLLL